MSTTELALSFRFLDQPAHRNETRHGRDSAVASIGRTELDSCTDVTNLLHEWAAGEREALDRLVLLLYEELQQLARRRLGQEGDDQTLGTTALVHETTLRLADVQGAGFRSREQFLGMAFRAMRQVLVDHARRRAAGGRGAAAQATPAGDVLHLTDEDAARLLELDDALNRLESVGARQARVLEQHCFGGLSTEEIAAAMDVAPSTAERDLRFARAWLATELGEDRPPR